MKQIATSFEVYAAKHQDENIRDESRSGGVFTALSDIILENGGVVYGCVLTDDFRATHIRTESAELRDLMRGSKYIQSEIGETYNNVKRDLDSGNKVLFSGTSCQVAGLRSFLGKEYNSRLICVDVVCHGVPSANVWLKYLEWQEKKTGKKIVAVDFRDKGKFGWRAHSETLTMNDGSKISSEVFANLLYGHTILRPCCYKCPYKDVIHPGDITIADYWGIETAAPEFDDNKGVSLVLVNTNSGRAIFEESKLFLTYKKTKIENSMQPPLEAPFSCPSNREEFWRDFYTKDFETVAKRYGGNDCMNMLRSKIRMMKNKVIKSMKG